MKLVDPIPRAVVLGNYASWSNADNWLAKFERFGVGVMENEVTLLETAEGPVCVRGRAACWNHRMHFFSPFSRKSFWVELNCADLQILLL